MITVESSDDGGSVGKDAEAWTSGEVEVWSIMLSPAICSVCSRSFLSMKQLRLETGAAWTASGRLQSLIA